MKSETYEVFAAHLLLSAPTDLIRKWSETTDATKGNEVVETELRHLDLSSDLKDFVRDVTQQFWPARNTFRGVGQAIGSTFYSGSEPHPTGDEMFAIIQALRELKR